jgi:hypothetical protein
VLASRNSFGADNQELETPMGQMDGTSPKETDKQWEWKWNFIETFRL